jgi:hypothetical protein
VKALPQLAVLIVAGVLGTCSLASAAGCERLVRSLSEINIEDASELAVSASPGTTYKQLFDECDAGNRFAGRKLPVLQGMKQKCSDDKNNVRYVRRFNDGTIVMNAKMSVDADGSPVAAGPNASPSDQAMTWLEFDGESEHHFANSEDISFVVIPFDDPKAGISFQKDTGLGQGDIALIVKDRHCSIAVIGDSGPYFKLGEASLKAHEDLGNPQCAVAGQHPCRKLISGGWGRSIAGDVTYVLFPGTRPKRLLSQTVDQVAAQAAETLVTRLLSSHGGIRKAAFDGAGQLGPAALHSPVLAASSN